MGVQIGGRPSTPRRTTPCTWRSADLDLIHTRVHSSFVEVEREGKRIRQENTPVWVCTKTAGMGVHEDRPRLDGEKKRRKPGVRVKRGSCPAASADGQPLHRYIIHRMRKPSPQRHSQPSPWGGPTGGGTASTPVQARQPPRPADGQLQHAHRRSTTVPTTCRRPRSTAQCRRT